MIRYVYYCYRPIVRILNSHSFLLCIPKGHIDGRNQVTGFVAKNNTTFKLKHGSYWVISIKVTASRNGNICIEGGRIHYLIPVCVSQPEITRTTCICLPVARTSCPVNSIFFCFSNSCPVSISIFKMTGRDECHRDIKVGPTVWQMSQFWRWICWKIAEHLLYLFQ